MTPARSPLPRLFVDDLGYGDLGFNGHPTTKTDNIDKLAYGGKVSTSRTFVFGSGSTSTFVFEGGQTGLCRLGLGSAPAPAERSSHRR